MHRVMLSEDQQMMTSNHDERWRELCEAIVEEADSKRLMELIEKLNQILEEREVKVKKNIAGE